MSMGNHKSGFTLLEILVVIIIVGVLASVAMPQLFRNVERSRSTEAMNILGATKRAIEACAMQFGGSYASCNTFAAIGMADPSTTGGTHFTYGIVVSGTSLATITATRNTLDSGNSGDTVVLANTNGVVTRSGTTAFAGIQ